MCSGLGCWWFLVLGVSVMQTVFSWDSFLTSIWHHLNGRNVIIILAPSLTSQCLTLNKTDVHQDSTRPYYTSELFLLWLAITYIWITRISSGFRAQSRIDLRRHSLIFNGESTWPRIATYCNMDWTIRPDQRGGRRAHISGTRSSLMGKPC